MTWVLVTVLLALPESVQDLVKALGSEDPAVRTAAAERLFEMGEEAQPALLQARNSTDPEIAAGAIEVLARIEAELVVSHEVRARNRWKERLTGIRAGMARDDALLIVNAARRGKGESDMTARAGQRSYSALRLDSDWTLVMSYDSTDTSVSSWEIRGFADLRGSLCGNYSLVRLIHEAPSPERGDWNPALLVKATNALFSSGRDNCIEALQAYVNACFRADEERTLVLDLRPDRVLPILALLYPEENQEAISYWPIEWEVRPFLELDKDPLFPIRIVDGVPFWPGGRVTANFDYERAPKILNLAITRLVLRPRPLEPGSATEAAARLLASEEWQRLIPAGHVEWQRCEVQWQSLRAMASVRHFSDADERALFPSQGADASEFWARRIGEIRSLNPIWEPATGRFGARSR